MRATCRTNLILLDLHDEELHNLYASENIIRVTKSRTMRLPGHAARMGR
jgi:hypothetical protein